MPEQKIFTLTLNINKLERIKSIYPGIHANQTFDTHQINPQKVRQPTKMAQALFSYAFDPDF